nr:hypothetical protein [uncultured Selenomonas sp.]
MAITPPTPPTPPSPPKITLGDAARDAQANQTNTTVDAQAEQQARDSVAQGGGALSKTTHETPKDKSATERPNAPARTDAAKGDSVSTSASKVDHAAKVEGQTGADVAKGLDLAQENAALKQQLAGTEQKQPQAPAPYTATSGLYWAGMIGVALVLGGILFRRFFQKRQGADEMEEPSLGERILAHDRESASHRRATHTQDTRERSTHGDLLAAAERTRRARDTRSELLPEFTGLTAGEALARLAEEEQAAPRTPSAVDAPPRTAASKPAAALPRTAGTKAQSAVPAPTASSAQKTPVKPTQKQDETEEKPRFEVRV